MKFILFTVVVFTVFGLICCGDLTPSGYALSLPEVPKAWTSLLGEPHWRIEWLDPEGKRQIFDILPGKSLTVELPVTWTNPVLASPFWPKHNLSAGIFYPAGALFPFDVRGSELVLTWEAGVDVVFYRNLALSAEQDGSKMPAYFDWLRFRELFSSGALNERVVKDPWLVDWQFVADRTVASSFDRRRLVPKAVEIKALPVPFGTWYGMSPFADPLIYTEGSGFPVSAGINVWFSDEGILRVNGNAWIFHRHTNN